MAGFTCPYCETMMAIDTTTKRTQYPAFDASDSCYHLNGTVRYHDSTIAVTFYKCPNCGQHTIFVKGVGKAVWDVNTAVRPNSAAKQYPDFIPQQIRSDYEEACSILYLSPKASATLSRRCLQGMIRDYWGIAKSRLYDEISALKDKIQPDLWQAINSLRQLGNIGAHMEKDTDLIVDIDPGEAEKLIKGTIRVF